MLNWKISGNQDHNPAPTVPTTPSSVNHTRKKMSSGRHGRKVTNRGDKPRSKQGRKSTPPPLPPSPAPHPSRRNWRNIDYLQLNDGLEEPAVISPKTKKKKPYSPPPRGGPSTSRQAANKKEPQQTRSWAANREHTGHRETPWSCEQFGTTGNI